LENGRCWDRKNGKESNVQKAEPMTLTVLTTWHYKQCQAVEEQVFGANVGLHTKLLMKEFITQS
jgi:hypothetical protein